MDFVTEGGFCHSLAVTRWILSLQRWILSQVFRGTVLRCSCTTSCMILCSPLIRQYNAQSVSKANVLPALSTGDNGGHNSRPASHVSWPNLQRRTGCSRTHTRASSPTVPSGAVGRRMFVTTCSILCRSDCQRSMRRLHSAVRHSPFGHRRFFKWPLPASSSPLCHVPIQNRQ